jgi:hypothetical protein
MESLSDIIYTKELCNEKCTAKTGCVQFAIGQEAPYLGHCDLYNTNFCTFKNLEQKKYHIYKPSLSNKVKCQFNWPQGDYHNQCNDTVGWTIGNKAIKEYRSFNCHYFAWDMDDKAA